MRWLENNGILANLYRVGSGWGALAAPQLVPYPVDYTKLLLSGVCLLLVDSRSWLLSRLASLVAWLLVPSPCWYVVALAYVGAAVGCCVRFGSVPGLAGCIAQNVA